MAKPPSQAIGTSDDFASVVPVKYDKVAGELWVIRLSFSDVSGEFRVWFSFIHRSFCW
jgi:hypothetical protein